MVAHTGARGAQLLQYYYHTVAPVPAGLDHNPLQSMASLLLVLVGLTGMVHMGPLLPVGGLV